MKRQSILMFCLSGLLGLLLLACGGSDPTAVEEAVAVQPTLAATAETTVLETITESEGETAEPTALPDLPSVPKIAGQASGLGGGVAGASGTAAVGDAAESSMVLAPVDVFSGTTFVLNTTLPTAPTAATVYEQAARQITTDEAYALARQFGFNGLIYEEAVPYEYRPQGDNAGVGSSLYYAFDGDKRLTLSSYGAFYEDRSIESSYPSTISAEQARAAADAFWQARGLLTDSFAAMPGYGGDIIYKRLIDGQPVNQPEAFTYLNNAGEVAFADYSVLPAVQAGANYPLISAEAAWQKILDGVIPNDIIWELLPSENVTAIEDTVLADTANYRFWQRTYGPGDNVLFNATPLVYFPVGDDGEPLVQVFNYKLVAPAADLNAIAMHYLENPQPIMVEGVIGADGDTVEMTRWEAEGTAEPLFLEGTIEQENGAAVLRTIDGQSYVLPNVPEDVAYGQAVFVFGWTTRDIGAAYPALEWENIETKLAADELPTEPEIIIDDPMVESFTYDSVTIDEITLAYYYMPLWSYTADGQPNYDSPPVQFQPAWRFTGTAQTAEEVIPIIFYVQAVDPAYIAPSP